jgi:hypothetical protein
MLFPMDRLFQLSNRPKVLQVFFIGLDIDERFVAIKHYTLYAISQETYWANHHQFFTTKI